MKEEEDNESPLFKIFLVVMFFGIIIAMAFGAIYFRTPQNQSEKVKYNNFEFTKTETGWVTEWEKDRQLYMLQFRYLPTETLSVPMIGQVNDSFFKGYIYVTFDPKSEGLQNVTLAAGELSLNLARALDYYLIPACTMNGTGCQEIITCENSTLPVMYLKEQGPTQVTLEGNCITLQGEGKELLRSVDRLLYVWYRITS